MKNSWSTDGPSLIKTNKQKEKKTLAAWLQKFTGRGQGSCGGRSEENQCVQRHPAPAETYGQMLLVSKDVTRVSWRRRLHLSVIIFPTNKHVVTHHYFNFPHVLFWGCSDLWNNNVSSST